MIIILGGTGYVGHAFSGFLLLRKLPLVAVSRQSCDYTEPGNLSLLRREVRGTFVVNCAGFTGMPNGDACELQKSDALSGNALLPGVIKTVCDDLGVPSGHVSSGCIFTGDRGGRDLGGTPAGFAEEDVPNFSLRQNNCGFYSGAKALGEEILGYDEVPGPDGRPVWSSREESTNYNRRLRTPFNQQASPRNFLTKLMNCDRLLDARNSLSQLVEFVRACWESREKRLPFGIFHMTNPGSITTREAFGLILKSPIGRKLTAEGKHFEFFKDEGDFRKVPPLSPRSNCVLDTGKLSVGGVVMSPVEEAIEKALLV